MNKTNRHRLVLTFLSLNLIFFGVLYSKSSNECKRIDYTNHVVIPTIAQKSFEVGCIKKKSDGPKCKIKALKYKNELIKSLGL